MALLVLAHGAGADFRHANMLAIAEAFAKQKIATLRFNFPFMESGRRRVGSQVEAVAAIVAALAVAKVAAPDLALFSGGHSYGGRMASHAALADDLGICGLVFCSFPLHPPKKPGLDRAAHLVALDLPMLFLSGTRDALAETDLLETVVAVLEADEMPPETAPQPPAEARATCWAPATTGWRKAEIKDSTRAATHSPPSSTSLTARMRDPARLGVGGTSRKTGGRNATAA